MTRVVARLETQGLIERVRSDDDARGWTAVLTGAGGDRLRQAWPSNLASVRRHFLDHLEGSTSPGSPARSSGWRSTTDHTAGAASTRRLQGDCPPGGAMPARYATYFRVHTSEMP